MPPLDCSDVGVLALPLPSPSYSLQTRALLAASGLQSQTLQPCLVMAAKAELPDIANENTSED